MYLAALARRNFPLSTYFVATLEGVGGGGVPQKSTLWKTKNLTSETTLFCEPLEEL